MTPSEELQMLLEIPIQLLVDALFYEHAIWYDTANKYYLMFSPNNTRMAQKDDYWYIFFGASKPNKNQICLEGLKDNHPEYLAMLIQKHTNLLPSDFKDPNEVHILKVQDKEHQYEGHPFIDFEGKEAQASFNHLQAKGVQA